MGPAAPIATGTGVALVLAGIVLRWYSVITLGRFFTTRVMTRADQTVVKTGPYRFVRHPSYTGALVTLLGVLLLPANYLTLPCFLLVVPGLAYRIHVEEKALVAGLGEPYREYMRHTKRLVPFVV
jgi:protein-S-isoprenylcysteine O-methyltransferase Ste14